MVTTETLTVATVAANAGGVRVDGEIRREGSCFVIYLGGRAVGQAGSLGAAAHQLVAALRRDLPSGNPHGNWGVAVHCLTNGRVGLLLRERAERIRRQWRRGQPMPLSRFVFRHSNATVSFRLDVGGTRHGR